MASGSGTLLLYNHKSSPEEADEKLVRKKKRTKPPRILDFSESSEPTKNLPIIEVDSLKAAQVLDVVPISMGSPVKMYSLYLLILI